VSDYNINVILNPGNVASNSRVATSSLEQLDSAASAAKTAIGSLAAALSIRELAQYADAWTTVTNKLVNNVKATENLTDVTSRLFDVAQDTRSGLEATATLYGRLESATRGTITSGDQLTKIVTTINEAMQVSGATTSEAQGALVQLSQAFGAGALRSEEFNSVNEAGPRIMQAIADSVGVARGELKNLASEGALTTDVIIRALTSQSAAIDAEFGRMTATFSSKLQVAENAATKFVGTNTSVQNAMSASGDVVIALANNLDVLATAAGAVGAVYASKAVGSIVASTTAALANVAASTTQAEALAAATLAAESAAIAATRKALADKDQATSAVAVAQAEYNVARGTNAEMLALDALIATKTNARAATLAYTQAEAAQAAATTEAAVAARAASGAWSGASGALALVGGPAGAATLAAIAIYAVYSNMQQGKEEAAKYAQSLDTSTASLRNMTAAHAAAAAVTLNKTIADQTEAVADQKAKVDALTASMAQHKAESDAVGLTYKANQSDLDDLAIAQAGLEDKENLLSATRQKLTAITAQQNGQLRENYVLMENSNSASGIAVGIQSQLNNILGEGNRILQQRANYVMSAVPKTSPDDAKVLDQLRQELELSKLTGKEKAEQAARDKISPAADPRDREEAARLGAQIYENNTKFKELASSTKDSTSAAKENTSAITSMAGELQTASLRGRELAEEQARLKLNKYATPEQVAEIKALAGAIFDAQQAAAANQTIKQMTDQLNLAAIGSKSLADAHTQTISAIHGLSAAGSDTASRTAAVVASQAAMSNELKVTETNARELAQAQAELSLGDYAKPEQIEQVRALAAAMYDANEQKRLASEAQQIAVSAMPQDQQDLLKYQQDQATLQAALDQKAITEQQYYAISAARNKQYNDKIKAQEQANMSQRLQLGSSMFGAMADLSKTFAGEQSGTYKAMFAVSKAFALADSIMKIQQGISSAWSLGWPAAIPAVSAVVAGTASIASTISGTKMAYATGGPVIGAGTGTSDSIDAKLSNGEYVVNAAATKRNYAALHAINSGGTVAGSSTATQTQMNVSVENNAPAGVQVQRLSDTDVRIIISEELDNQLSGRVATELSDPYSSSNGALQSNYQMNRSTNG